MDLGSSGLTNTNTNDALPDSDNGKMNYTFNSYIIQALISKKISDSSVPMSLLADHPNVQFNYLRSGVGTCEAEMH